MTLSYLPLFLLQATAPLRTREGLVPCPLSAGAPDGSSQPSFSRNHPPNTCAQTGAGQVQAGMGQLPVSSRDSPSRRPECPFRVSACAELSPPVMLEEGPVTPYSRPPSVPAGPATWLCPEALLVSSLSLMSLLDSDHPQERPAFFSPLPASRWTLSVELRVPFPENTWPLPIPAYHTFSDAFLTTPGTGFHVRSLLL